MRKWFLIGMTFAWVLCMFGQTALADPCPCNCYFSGDCSGGAFCNWGNLAIEDTCFWRLPKPQGAPGAGCDEVYDDWGQCDGICDSGGSDSVFDGEDPVSLIKGVQYWAGAIGEAAQTGGGFLSEQIVSDLAELRFEHQFVHIALGRSTIEALMYARGYSFAILPDGRRVFPDDVAIQADANRAGAARAAEFIVQTLVAEMREEGAGRTFFMEIDPASLDSDMLAMVCGGADDTLGCVYGRIADMGRFIGRGGLVQTSGPPTCAGEPELGDITSDGTVDMADADALVSILLGNPPDPSWNVNMADANADHKLNGMDIGPFAALLIPN